MNEIPITQRVFPFSLAAWYMALYASYLYWLRHLLDRLGSECALSIWQQVCQHDDDGLTLQVLGTGWEDVEQELGFDVDGSIAALLRELFPTPIEGVTPEQARLLVEKIPPFPQVRQTFPSMDVWKEITAYEALHLSLEGPALLTEALLRSHGKQGELIAYDVLRQERIWTIGGQTARLSDFIAQFTAGPEDESLFTAGLEKEIVRVSEQEMLVHITGCEWARYFQERHPQVGYLVACSTDETAYRELNKTIRLQRTSTLMEGGKFCDFRIYKTG